MGYGTNKLKIVWICHFLNQSIREKLGISTQEKEYAPWITLGLEEIRKRDDLELHLIAPLNGIIKNKNFSENNIHYHFIKTGVPLLKTNWPYFLRFDLWTNFYFFNYQVRNLINRINPDLIDLHGAENAYYASSVLSIKKYPILVTIQGFLSLNEVTESKNPYIKKRLIVEKRILETMKYFGIEAGFMGDYIRRFNPQAKIFFFHVPYAKISVKPGVRKVYDIVFFAKLVRQKGIEDLINAVSIVRKQRPEVSLVIIGKGEENYVSFLKQLVDDLGLKSNVIFKGFIPTQEEMLEEVVKARISVLPTYNDTIPGTVVESMHLHIPVISYNVGGVPDLNQGDERIIIVEKGNIERLAAEIDELLGNGQKRIMLAEKAFTYVSAEFDNTNSINKLIIAYKNILKEVNH